MIILGVIYTNKYHTFIFSVIIKNMLEKNEENIKNRYFDGHFHYSDCKGDGAFDIEAFSPSDYWTGISCAHSIKEWNIQNEDNEKYNLGIKQAFGLHPQSAGWIDVDESAGFLEKLINEKKVAAIGEAGFDYFSQDFRDKKDIQEKMWNIQLDLAISAGLPLIVHCRKANEKLFEYSKKIKLVPAVLFHSFMGTPVEALSLCKRGINGFFSFGKEIMNNNKKVIACMSELPLDRLLCETDGPFQFLKGQARTNISDIKTIYKAAFALRKDCPSFEVFQEKLENNFNNMLGSRV